VTPGNQRSTARAADAVDPPAGAVTRFLVELVAWVSGPLAVAEHNRVLAVALFVVLAGLPAVFNVPGDKHQRPPVAVSGTIRIGIEVALVIAAVVGSAFAFPWWTTACVAVLALAMVTTQLPRWRWLRGHAG
jgi:hypothetical protein